jgi:ribonuclease J
MPNENIFIMDIGNVLELDSESASITGSVPSGKVFIDGLGIGDVGNIVLRDRKLLSQDGMVIVIISVDKETGTIVAEPDIISRGFVYVRESEEIIEQMRKMTYNVLMQNTGKDWGTMKNLVRDTIKEHLYSQLKRNPMILPIIIEV